MAYSSTEAEYYSLGDGAKEAKYIRNFLAKIWNVQAPVVIYNDKVCIHPSNGTTAQIGPWPPLLRFRNNNVLWCEVFSFMTNPR
jgi:hypothetical protein